MNQFLSGKRLEAIHDAGTRPEYRLRRVGEVYASVASATLSGVANAYAIAKNGGRHYGWYLQQLNLANAEIEKGIASFEKQIRKHQGWIDNPRSKNPDFFSLHPDRQAHLVAVKWPQDIRRQQESIEILRGILEDRKHGNT